MCGIVGAVAQRNIVPILVEGLRRLEYRGYDSCGVAAIVDGAAKRARTLSRVADLDQQIRDAQFAGETGIAHTRWATHGAPVTHNAHPIFSHDTIALVHNGIIENYEGLREQLRASGYEFVTQTDTEQLHGAYAIAVFSKDQPHRVCGARVGSPLVVGLGQGENFLASDALALAGSTDQFIFLEEGDVVELTLDGVRIADRDSRLVQRDVRTVNAYGGAVELGPYRHFMQKEIFEQPRAISDTIPQTDAFDPALFGTNARDVFNGIDSLLILACGTSYYSGLTAKYWLESIAKIPTQVEIASEYRYRDSVPNPRSLIVVISQSGETADTLAALKHAQALGHRHTLSVCNVSTSAMVQLTTLRLLTHAGTEIG
ncbi:hypothetical protein DFQ30_004246, partial [Apophysomyces sp. BC1015]